MEIKDEILRQIKEYHRGAYSPIYSSELERRWGLSGPTLRGIIRELRRSGEPIGNCDKGYYYCTNRIELDSLIRDLRGRALSMLETVSSLEKNREKPGYQQMGFAFSRKT